MIPTEIDKVPLCKPIKEFLEMAEENGYKIVEQKLRDYHFHELYFKIKPESIHSEKLKEIEGIQMHETGQFFCNCHWSTVEIIEK
ncbi:MAG: hypothetical protein FD123_336 [Bacteroidetes bacterium]|nr:MAG: hypothetical protein FD123_336 [Bacteroidota bacterium]